MLDDVTAIQNIISSFAHHIDRKDFKSVGELFSEMTYTASQGGIGFDVSESGNPPISGVENLTEFYARILTDVNASWLKGIASADDPGAVGTKHVFTNPITIIDPDGQAARAAYYGTVYAFTTTVPLRIRYSGRYYDTFRRKGDGWKIISRHQAHDYMEVDHPGTTVGYE